jgi:hypothetical protein
MAGSLSANFNCNTYYDYLFDRSPHFDDDILKDWFPTDDAWIGQVQTLSWDAFTGTQHVYDRIHVGAPDMSQTWAQFDTTEGNFIGYQDGLAAKSCTQATWNEIAVGWGSERKTYSRYKQSYTTNPLFFDQINTRAKAKEQMSEFIKGVKEMTKMIQSDYLRTASLFFSDALYVCGSGAGTPGQTPVALSTANFMGQALEVDIGGIANLPTSELTVQYLQRFYEPLQYEGYFKSKYVPNGTFKLITDPLTSQQLVQMNPSLADKWKFETFQKGGELFKYGMSAGIGNFGIAWDGFPMRFYWGNSGRLRRVWPYTNVPTTIGVKRKVASEYILAPYQISQIWHPEAMKRLVPSLQSVHPDMPFLTRDLAGKWQFLGGNRDKTIVVRSVDTNGNATQTIVDNKRGNIGLLWADFENAIKFERPELIRNILHQREPGCVTDLPACSVAPAYVTQRWSANDLCAQVC